MKFKLKSSYQPTGDQPDAIDKLTNGLNTGLNHQVLLGVTGSGKTFTMANVIEKVQKPTLIISHNKTLAAQLYQEFRDYFPENSVSYFVSYYDYYQPEAYIPQSDTYIEKETEINEEIDKLRLAATMNLLTRPDTIIVASVSCIYNIGSPREYGHFVLELKPGVKIARNSIMERLIDLQYLRSDYGFHRGTFRVRGEIIDLFPAYQDTAIRIVHDGEKVISLSNLDPLNGKEISKLDFIMVYPAKHYMTDPEKHKEVFKVILHDLGKRVKDLQNQGKTLEAHRLNQRVHFDLEMIQEMGYVNGIENYSRYFDGRNPGDPPYTLLDYYKEPYKNDWLLFIDESHMTIPQIHGMYNGDKSRKQTLIDFGFRLPAALDNRPLKFEEFIRRIPQTIYVSATPAVWELSLAKENAFRKLQSFKDEKSKENNNKTGIYDGVAEQLIRPTGIVDPKVTVRPEKGQINDLVKEIITRKEKGERVLVTTLTKRIAEDLSIYLNDKKYLESPEFKDMEIKEFPKIQYLHSDIQTLERTDILSDLRSGKYDVLIGINLLREGLDLPEVSLVAILDADKEGFLRSRVSLIQTMGRAARHVKGEVIMYATNMTDSMKAAIDEIERRRKVQLEYNSSHHITAESISKPIRERLTDEERETEPDIFDTKKESYEKLFKIDLNQIIPEDRERMIKKLQREMKRAATDLNFELAAKLRDKIKEIRTSV